MATPPSLPSLANLKHPRWHEPPSPSIFNAATPIWKVRQPWADALVTGKKDVENRTKPITKECGPDSPVWFVVASSLSRPSKAVMADYERRLKLQYPWGRPYEEDPDDYPYSHMVGIVKIKACSTSSSSIWYNQGDIGWIVEDAWEFVDSIPLHPEDKMQTQASLGLDNNKTKRSAFGYVEKVREEVAKLIAGYT
jgi:hypothetical protein